MNRRILCLYFYSVIGLLLIAIMIELTRNIFQAFIIALTGFFFIVLIYTVIKHEERIHTVEDNVERLNKLQKNYEYAAGITPQNQSIKHGDTVMIEASNDQYTVETVNETLETITIKDGKGISQTLPTRKIYKQVY